MKKLRMTLLVVLLSAGTLLADVEIGLPRSVVVDSEYMKLSDIAQVKGDNAQKIGKVFLGPSPRVGSSMTILRSDILERLRGMGLDSDVVFSGSLGVAVAREGGSSDLAVEPVRAEYRSENMQENYNAMKAQPQLATDSSYEDYRLKAEKAAGLELVRQAIKEFVGAKLHTDMQIIMNTKLSRFELDGTIGTEADVEGIERGKIPGRATLAVVFSNKGRVCGYASVDVSITMEVDTVVLARNIRAGETVRAQDFVVNRLDYKPNMILEDIKPEELDGRLALKSVRSGLPISSAYFGDPLDVEKGQMVTVLVQGKGFSIKEMALALNSGNVGDTIKVESVVNNSVYPVRITGKNKADMPVNSL